MITTATPMADLTRDSVPVRLHYFKGWGKAEQARWMLASAGIAFENVALTTPEDFNALKREGKLMFGQVPLLEIDGLCLIQSQAIVRYVARKGGLMPEDPAEAALCDMVAETCSDARGLVVSAPFQMNDLEAHKAKLPALYEKYFPKFEALLEDTAGKGGAGPWILPSGTLCYADVLLGELLHGHSGLNPGCVDAFPRLSALMKAVLALPGVDAYLKDPARRYPFPEGEVAAAYVRNVNHVLGRD